MKTKNIFFINLGKFNLNIRHTVIINNYILMMKMTDTKYLWLKLNFMYFKYQNSRHLLNLMYQSQVFKEHAVPFNKHKVLPKEVLFNFKRRKKQAEILYI